MPPRLYVDPPLRAGWCALPPAAARHVQVLRLRPGAELVVFDGGGGEWRARLHTAQQVELIEHRAVEREAEQRVLLAVGMPANERMDWLVEKATELGAAALQPLITQRSVLRLSGERARKRLQHWRGIAIAASEQCGRNTLIDIAPVRHLTEWLREPPPQTMRCLLSPQADAAQTLPAVAPGQRVCVLSGPEGGLDAAEQALALAAGFAAVSLGPRVLRAETAPLAALMQLTVPRSSA
ncbi:MAG: 16S rRNA (uracil(1498)-N(3))-methyltransferase [Thiomonas sp.]|jgi:16S rRNA (uracil1498-N3)-methyltransferase